MYSCFFPDCYDIPQLFASDYFLGPHYLFRSLTVRVLKTLECSYGRIFIRESIFQNSSRSPVIVKRANVLKNFFVWLLSHLREIH